MKALDGRGLARVVAVVAAGATLIASQVVGSGVADAATDAVRAAAPNRPATVVAVPGSNQVTVKWTPPVGGDPVVDYLVQKSIDGGASWSTVVGSPVAAPGTSLVATRLANRKPIVFRVASRNADGTSPWSLSRTVVPSEVRPLKPSFMRGTSPRKGTIVLVFRPPASGPAPTAYDWRVRKGFTTFTPWKRLPPTARTVTITGLVSGADYLCKIRSVRGSDLSLDAATQWVRVK